jgi:hypothetical protein
MTDLPLYLWLITFAGSAGIATMTCIVIYNAGIRANLGRRRTIVATVVAAAVIGGWFVFSTIFAAADGYQIHPGRHTTLWLPVAVVVFGGALFLLTLLPIVRQILRAPGINQSLMHPHWFRVVGVVFLTAMVLGALPPLFALPAGLGDLAVSIAAPFVAAKLARGTGHRAAVWWNVLGITDLAVALTLGGLAAFGFLPGTPPVLAITVLPLVIIPTAPVPLLIVLHVRSLIALAQDKRSAGSTAPGENSRFAPAAATESAVGSDRSL